MAMATIGFSFLDDYILGWDVRYIIYKFGKKTSKYYCQDYVARSYGIINNTESMWNISVIHHRRNGIVLSI